MDQKEIVYEVKGYWSIEGIFNGSIFKNDSKFGTVVRVQSDKIACTPSFGKDQNMKEFKRWLISNKLTSFKFLTKSIEDYESNHKEKRLKLI